MCTLLQPTRSYTNPCLLKAILVNSFENFLVHDSIVFLKQVSLQHVWCVNYYNPLVFKPTAIFWKQFCSIPLRISWFVIPFLWVDLILVTMVSSVLVGCHGKLCFVIFCFFSNKNFFLYHVCLASPRCTRLLKQNLYISCRLVVVTTPSEGLTVHKDLSQAWRKNGRPLGPPVELDNLPCQEGILQI